MTTPVTAKVPILDPTTGLLPDRYQPQAVTNAVASTAAAATTAAGSATSAAMSATTATTQAGNAATSATAAASSAASTKVTGQYRLADYIAGAPDLTGATDYTAALNAAHAAMYAGGGGTLTFPVGSILIAGQIILPNDGNLIPAPKQRPITWRGSGGHFDGQNNLGSGGTRLVFTYQSATYNNAQVVTRGLGLFTIRDIVFQDPTSASQTPFVYTTLTTLKVHGNAFLGANEYTACQKDAIVLGGSIKYPTAPVSGNGYGDPDAPFQGYGTTIHDNYFNGVRRIVYGRSFANQVIIRDNFADKGCGTNLTGGDGSCVAFDGSLSSAYPGDTCAANVITGNYFENTGGYTYQVLLRGASNNVVAFNGAEDAGVLIAMVRIEGQTISGTNYPSTNNRVLCNFTGLGVAVTTDAMSTNRNFDIAGDYGAASVFPAVSTTQIAGQGSGVHVKDLENNLLLNMAEVSNRPIWAYGPFTVVGNTYNGSPAGTMTLRIGNGTVTDDAALILNGGTGKTAQIQYMHNSAASWLLYDAASPNLYLRDNVNGVMAMVFSPGPTTTGQLELGGKLKIDGSVGFNGTAPLAKPTLPAAAVDAATTQALVNSIRALLIAYGLSG